MAFTSRIGVIPGSQLGNLELGATVASLPAPIVQVVPVGYTPKYFTGQVGLVLSTAANIVPGRPFMRMLKGLNLTANLTFKGKLISFIYGKLLYSSIATVITQLRTLVVKVVKGTTAQIDTLPFQLDITTRETDPISVDWTQYLSGTDSLSSAAPTAELQLILNNQLVSSFLGGTIGISGNVVQVPIDATQLQAGQSYYLLLTCTLNTGKRLTARTQLNVVV